MSQLDELGLCPGCGPEGCTTVHRHEEQARADVVEEIAKALEAPKMRVMFDYPEFVRRFKVKHGR